MTLSPEPNSIHLSCSRDLVGQGVADTLAVGGKAFEFSLEGISSEEQLVIAFAKTFDVPWPIYGMDAVISTASDLEWFGSTGHYAVTVRALESTPKAVLVNMCKAFPRIIDRMRSGHDSYLLMFERSQRTSQILEFLEAENERLRYLERVDPKSDTHPVPIVDHRTDPPTIR